MEEKNRQSLRRALETLPAYEPPELVWTELAAQLDRQDRERPLREAIGRLRAYEPPEFIWTQISSSLNRTPAGKLRRLAPRLAAVAATVALLFVAINFWSNRSSSPKIAYLIEEKAATSPVLIQADWNADEELIGEVVSLLEESPKAGVEPAYQTLKEELDELNEAKEELEMLMEKYGQDAGTIRQLKEIEMERTSIIKEMAALI